MIKSNNLYYDICLIKHRTNKCNAKLQLQHYSFKNIIMKYGLSWALVSNLCGTYLLAEPLKHEK